MCETKHVINIINDVSVVATHVHPLDEIFHDTLAQLLKNVINIVWNFFLETLNDV